MRGITVYTTEPCGFCNQLKALLRKRGLEYVEINLSKDPAGRTQLALRTGMMTFPQVVVGERLIGGFAEVYAADLNGELTDLLAA
jgi:glutaredoxin 3